MKRIALAAVVALIPTLLSSAAMAQMDSDFSIGGAIRVGTSATPCDSAALGGIRYNSGGAGAIEFCNGTAWTAVGTSGSAASPTRGIQFNSGGSFAADAAFIYTAGGRLGVGTTSPSHTISLTGTGAAQSIGMEIETTATTLGRDLNIYAGGTSGGSNRNGGNLNMYTGRATGNGSASMQFYTVQQGQGSGSGIRNPTLSMTLSSNALTVPYGQASQRPGSAGMQAAVNGMIRYNVSNDKFEVYENGAWINMIGGAVTVLGTSVTANNPQISGDAASGLFAPAASTVSIATAGTEAIRVASNQRVGIGQTTPQAKLDVNGGVRIGNSANPCLSTNAGELIWDGVNVQICNGINWTTLGTPACGQIANPITYAAQDNIALSTQVSSNIALIAGMGCTSVNIALSGPGSPEYRICADSGCASVLQNWGVTVSSIQSGQYVQLRQTSSASQAATNTANLIVGATTAIWQVTTVGPKIMFTTSTTYNGDLGGLSGADTKCQDRATAGGLPGTYKAWLSSSTVSASSRLDHSTLAYKNTNNQIVQTNWSNLTSGGNLLAQSGYNEFGAFTSDSAWTNTTGLGAIKQATALYTCNDWNLNSNVYRGYTGMPAHSSGSFWTDFAGGAYDTCDYPRALLCVQQ